MAAIAAATKSYFVAVEDGWTQIVTGASTPINQLRITAYPHTHPIQVAAASSKPALTVSGVTVCHQPFKVADATNGINAIFYVRISNPSNQLPAGKVRIDVYAEGGVLS